MAVLPAVRSPVVVVIIRRKVEDVIGMHVEEGESIGRRHNHGGSFVI